MNGFPSREQVEKVKNQYPKGTRIALIRMDDPYSSLMPGDRATVEVVDDNGSIMVRWDNGEGLSVAYGEDSCRKLTQAELEEEQSISEEQGQSDTEMKMGGM